MKRCWPVPARMRRPLLPLIAATMSSANCRFIAMRGIVDSGAPSELHALVTFSRNALLATGPLPADRLFFRLTLGSLIKINPGVVRFQLNLRYRVNLPTDALLGSDHAS